jgi:hypothetical protein
MKHGKGYEYFKDGQKKSVIYVQGNLFKDTEIFEEP